MTAMVRVSGRSQASHLPYVGPNGIDERDIHILVIHVQVKDNLSSGSLNFWRIFNSGLGKDSLKGKSRSCNICRFIAFHPKRFIGDPEFQL